MGFIRNKYADLSGCKTPNGTRIVEFVRTDPSGPVWKLRCSCGAFFFLAHSRIASAIETASPVYCGECVIPTVQTESLADIRKAERADREKADATAREKAAQKAKLAANDAANRAEFTRYIPFAISQINAGVPVNSPNFMNFDRWMKQGEHWQNKILERIKKNELSIA